ncbi:MAG: PLD nuclease N-terminal domain-containing protein [Actinomycetes bacterium]
MRFLIYAVAFVVVLYSFIDLIQTPAPLIRALPKWLWFLVIIMIPVVGAVAFLIFGRARESVGAGVGVMLPGRRRGTTAPDDDPAFLRRIDDDAWQVRMRKRREGKNGSADGATPPSAGEGDDSGTTPGERV